MSRPFYPTQVATLLRERRPPKRTRAEAAGEERGAWWKWVAIVQAFAEQLPAAERPAFLAACEVESQPER